MKSSASQAAPGGGVNRGLYLGFLLVLAVFLSSAAICAVNGQAVLRDHESVERSEHVLRAQLQVRADIASLEGAARGYVLTKRQEFLTEYGKGKVQLEDALQNLRSLMPPGHPGKREFSELSLLKTQRFADLDTAIARAKRGMKRPEENDPAVIAARATRQKLNDILDTMQETEAILVEERQKQVHHSVEWASSGLWGSAIIGVLALIGLFLAVRRYVESSRKLSVVEQSRAEELEERVRERTWELSQANRDLEAFSYSVSHDLRAPLRAMNGFASMLKKDLSGRLDTSETQMLERIQRNCVKMSELTESLLALFRVGKAELTVEEVNLSAMAAEVVTELRTEYAGRDYMCDIQPGLLVMGDRQMLNALLVNLLGNAMKFSAKVPAPRIELWKAEDVFAIRDNGAGFDPSQSGMLFEPFHRLHAESEFAGNGVGLAMCRKIVTRHRGTIWLDSEIGVGTTVRFRLGMGQTTSRVRETVVEREPVQGSAG